MKYISKKYAVMAFTVLLSALLCLMVSASAEEMKKQQRYEIPDSCAFQVKDIKSYDIFLNQESGSSKQFIAVTFSLMNLRTEPFYVKTETAARLVYDGDFEYDADDIWANPEGSYYAQGPKVWLYVYEMDDEGNIISSGEDLARGYSQPTIRFEAGYERIYDPINVAFYYIPDGPENEYAYQTRDPSKTVLDPLVERTYHYVFLVPDVVAEDEGLRELILTIDGEEYTLRF